MVFTYKATVEEFTVGKPIECGYIPSSVPQKYSPREFNINRFMNYLLIKKTDPDTCIYRAIKFEGTATAHVGINILKTVTVKTPKDLLRFVLSKEGNSITEVIYNGIRYVCIYHSLFEDKNTDILNPVFLATFNSKTNRRGLILFPYTINKVKSGLASTIMGSLVPLVSTNGGKVIIEENNTICKLVYKKKFSAASIRFTPKLGLDIAKYYEKVWKNG